MPAYLEHEITRASFAQIDREIAERGLGDHGLSAAAYVIARRIIHTTADFEFLRLLKLHGGPMDAATQALKKGAPIVTDVSMVSAGIGTVVRRTWRSPVIVAVQQATANTAVPAPMSDSMTASVTTRRTTRSAQGMRQCSRQYFGSIVAIGNAPTALLALCEDIAAGRSNPAVVIGAPVGFINVLESKQALAALSVPHILVTGRKGGSAVAAAILNALMIWSWEQS